MKCFICAKPTQLGCSVCRTRFCSNECFGFVGGHACPRKDVKPDYSFLKWVRGTNNWIFLSLYKKGGKFHLLTKGDQYREGIMPMIGAIDAGGKLYGGVNFSWNSVYPNTKLSQAAAYAYKEDKGVYNIKEVYDKLQEAIDNEYEDVILYCHYLLKIAQYTGSTKSTQKQREKLKENPYIPLAFKSWSDYLGTIDRILDYAQRTKGVVVTSQHEMKELVKSISGLDDLYLGRPIFADPVADAYTEDRWLQETQKSIFFKSGLANATYNVFAMLFFRPAFLRANIDSLRQTVDHLRQDVSVGQNLWKICIEGKKFHTLSPLDKSILDNRVNFLLGSTTVEAKLFDVNSDEYVVPSCVLGKGGADVIIFRDQDSKKKIKKLIRDVGLDSSEFRLIVDQTIVPGGISLADNF